MAYSIEKQLIPGLNQGKLTASNFIVAHESGNPKNTGPNSLENELSYMKNNHKNAFTSHWVGGGGRIVQLAEVGKIQYGAGPKVNPFSYAHVELARTSNKETFKKDYAAYIWLLRKLATDAGIPKVLDTGSKVSDRGIKTHDWITKNIGGTTHTDPYAYLASHGVSKAQFKKDVETGLKEVAGVSTEKIELTTGQKNAFDKLVKHGLMAKDYEVKDSVDIRLITMLAPLLTKLEAKGSL